MPIPGIKPMIGLVPLACNSKVVATMSDPGYPVSETWCGYLQKSNYSLPLNTENEFLFSVEDVKRDTDLIMINFPNNPSGQVAPKEWLVRLCGHCQKNNIRIFNDAAYIKLVHCYYEDSPTLTDVAVDFPDLSFAETFSASKEIGNGTGWRVGAIVGSDDFIGDIGTIKGNTDSGAVAAMMAGALHSVENDWRGIESYNQMYAQRTRVLVDILTRQEMQLVLQPKATFFSFWKVPNEAFGKTVENAEHFNNLMIENTGIVGVPFGEDHIRYSVAGYPINKPDEAFKVHLGFQKADVVY